MTRPKIKVTEYMYTAGGFEKGTECVIKNPLKTRIVERYMNDYEYAKYLEEKLQDRRY